MTRETGAAELWQCPHCLRSFANRNQSHACGTHDLAHHFEGKPAEIRALFDLFVAALQSLGPLTVLPQKTRVAFQVRMSFAQLTPKRRWIDGHLVLAERHEGPPVRRITSLSPRNHVHEFRLTSAEDLGPDLLELMRRAYLVGEQRHLAPRVSRPG